jgi:hypothetical protein
LIITGVFTGFTGTTLSAGIAELLTGAALAGASGTSMTAGAATDAAAPWAIAGRGNNGMHPASNAGSTASQLNRISSLIRIAAPSSIANWKDCTGPLDFSHG